MPDIWHRIEVHRTAVWDYDNETVSHYNYHIQHTEYEVVRYTRKGVWVRDKIAPFFGETFVLGKATKQLCVPTIELAYKDELARRERHVRGARHRLKQAEDALKKLKDSKYA